MIIFVDESGSFAPSTTKNSWNIVAACVITERIQTKVRRALMSLKSRSGIPQNLEAKLGDIAESAYVEFLAELHGIGSLLFAVAMDAGLNSDQIIIEHRREQAKELRKNIPRMIYESGKQAVSNLAEELECLSPQLYVQLNCQVQLFDDLLKHASLYYVQRDPVTLRRFKWRIDQKNTTRTLYEKTFLSMAPMLLQSISFRDPWPMLEGADYRYISRFEYKKDEIPQYLNQVLGRSLNEGFNVGKMLGDDLEFANSKENVGVQIADLLASGIRRCLKMGFRRNAVVAKLLGSLMVQSSKERQPLKLVGFDTVIHALDRDAARVVMTMKGTCRPMLTAEG